MRKGKVGQSLSRLCLPGAIDVYWRGVRNKEMQKRTLHVSSVGDRY